jgi:DNA-binding MurR/RpiR family transcriptional regulator
LRTEKHDAAAEESLTAAPPFLNAVAEQYHGLSKGHKRVAEYLFRSYDKAAFMTASVLGEAAGVSESTVVRFAVEVGYKGYPELQNYLQEAVRGSLNSIQRMQVGGARLGEATIAAEQPPEVWVPRLLEHAMAADAEMIRRTAEQTSPQSFLAAVNAINGARNIYVQGTRSSAALANFLALNLNILCPGVIYVDAFSESQTYEQLMRISEEDIFIAISFPRYSKHTVTALRFARERGALAIAITDSTHSPIAELAEIALAACSDTVSFVDSLVAPLSLINALLATCARSQGDKVYSTLSHLEQIWDRYDMYDIEDQTGYAK